MRVIIGGEPREFRALWWEGDALWAIDQRRLPLHLDLLTLRRPEEVATALRGLALRGPLTVRVAGAYGLALALRHGAALAIARALLMAARPASWDLQQGLAHVARAAEEGRDPLAAAHALAEGIVDACARLSRHGAALLPKGARVLTHGNPGALATVDVGTALGVVREAHRQGRLPHVLVSEARPRMQGLLSAWELHAEGVAYEVLPDAACGAACARGGVDVVLVGAHRVAANGDVVAKAGTYEKALLAARHGIPFYVATPLLTLDQGLPDGLAAPVEERSGDEVLHLYGHRYAPNGTRARNPSSDVTPADLVTGYITEQGVLKPQDLARRPAPPSGS